MTLLANSLPSPSMVHATSQAAGAPGFIELDNRVVNGGAGLAVVRAPSREAAEAIATHVARRARCAGLFTIEARAGDGAPLWRDVSSRLGVAGLSTDPARAADAIAQAIASRRAMVVASLPRAGGWDRAVAAELAGAAAVILFTTGRDATEDWRAEVYDVGATLDPMERQRWWLALADTASTEVATEAIASLDAWWSNARSAPLSRCTAQEVLPPASEHLLGNLALVSRSWPATELSLLAADGGALDALARLGAVRVAGGWITLAAAWVGRARAIAAACLPDRAADAARALASRFEDDPWALTRTAELLTHAGQWAVADEAFVEAMAHADESLARRELVARWTDTVTTLPSDAQLTLRTRAAERALAMGEADQAFRWAQSAAALAPGDSRVTLLLGRAAMATGDLVAARVAFEREAERATDNPSRAVVAAELGELAFTAGDLPKAKVEAELALTLTDDAATRLKARSVLGRILLAESRWDEADVHFAQDGWTAASAQLSTEELRARLNRGIALLSNGRTDEARVIFEAVNAEGARTGTLRASAFALHNLSVIAVLAHDYAESLDFSERAVTLWKRLGDRLNIAHALGNLAELRRTLGLIDHAEHAVAFGRRMLGPGMPPARAQFFSLQAAQNALLRGNTVEARREVTRAIAEAQAGGMHHQLCGACYVATRIALEDGDLERAREMLSRTKALTAGDEGVYGAQAALVAAQYAMACGESSADAAAEALAAARASGKEDLIIEAHMLVAQIHRAAERDEEARANVEQAIALRDQVASGLTSEVRAAFLSRPDLLALAKLDAVLGDAPTSSQMPPPSQTMARASVRDVSAASREIIGDDPAIRALRAAIKKVARSNSTVLVRGESGTGKELVAEAIHRSSDRAAGPLVSVNCAALVEALLLSELFGHEKGAFTGASARRRGRFELAEGGTLFLDEIGDISPRTQVALLRVLQERTFERVGGTAPIHANVRIICATHRDLKAMVERGEFREDLYYRLRGITLEVPALRTRIGDLPRISEHLLVRIANERGEDTKLLSPEALDLLARHRWPGNIRELENAMRAAALFAEGETISASTLIENVDDLRGAAHFVRTRPTIPPPASSAVEMTPTFDPAGDDDPETQDAPLPPHEANATAIAYAQVRGGNASLPDIKRQIERDCIARALAETRGNITRAAMLLGMKRPRLSQLVKQYGFAAISSEGM